jgi:hypothetical protein
MLRTESRKAVKVPEAFMFFHGNLIARFLGPLQLIKPAKTEIKMMHEVIFNPLAKEMIQNLKGIGETYFLN